SAFDIDWDAPGLDGKLLLPVLGGPLADVLARGELALDRDDPRGPAIRYFERAFPVAPTTRLDGGLADVIAAQHYELADWHDAPTRINYRRFFDITDLVSLHQEDPAVFGETHRTILALVADGSITGLRIDHVDGLADPADYLERLHAAAPELYVVVEKILAADERLRESWPIAGTTGYEVLDAIGSVLVDAGGATELEALFARVAGVEAPFYEVALAAKHEIMAESFPGDLRAVARTLEEPGEGDIAAITAITAGLDVYRTYGGNGEPFGDEDRARVAAALDRAWGTAPEDALERVGGVLLDGSSQTVRRWQQLTGPVAAKGVEDTAIYRFPVLVSRDEVGADPGAEPLTVSALHRLLAARGRSWPGALTPLTTHDTKHGEDTRARIGVLASLADRYARVVSHLIERHDGERREVTGRQAPSRIDELVLYQNLLGAWPLDDAELPEFSERIVAYMAKAAHEQKLRTSWTEPDEEYEAELTRFALLAIDTFRGDAVPDLRELRDAVAWYGALDGLSQTLVRLVAPGVPYTYQGCELWNLTLVDPDNRRPVDYARRARLLDRIAIEEPPSVEIARDALAGWRDGRVKLLVTARALHLRRAVPELFAHGEYLPLPASGAQERHVIAFARRHDDAWAIAIVPRLPVGLAPVDLPPLGRAVFTETVVTLPDGAPTAFTNALTGERVTAHGGRIAIGEALETLPIALLTG
ncbi:MAG TPA: malto-oligosyltrehalose synthase, partial [Gaiellales bacterium]